MLKDKKYFVIYNEATGKYSKGGTFPSFTKNGKAWNSLTNIKSHLRNVMRHNSRIVFSKEMEEYANSIVVDVLEDKTICKVKDIFVELFPSSRLQPDSVFGKMYDSVHTPDIFDKADAAMTAATIKYVETKTKDEIKSLKHDWQIQSERLRQINRRYFELTGESFKYYEN